MYFLITGCRHRNGQKTRSDSSSISDSTISTTDMEQLIEKFSAQSHRSTTKKNYLSVWSMFSQFYLCLDRKPSSWEDRLLLFVGFLIQNKKKSTTIRSYISAIRAMLKEVKVILNEDDYMIKALTRACKLTVDRVNARLPIHKAMLHVLIKKIKIEFHLQPYLCILYQSLLLTAYFGLFRIGELTSGDHPVKAVDVHIG